MSKKVLIVDDDPLVLESLNQELARVGIVVETAEDGQKGLNKALTSHPDLLVIDLRMPEMDGLTLIEKIRADQWGKSVPIVVLSTDESTGSINQALKAGVTVYIPKSGTTSEQISSQVMTALGLS